MKNSNTKMDMLNGSLFDKILKFALPLAICSILQTLFNSVDTAVVGRFSSKNALAAVGSNASLIALLINLFVGISVGANVVIANYIGRKETKKVKDAVSTAMITAVVSGIMLMIIGLIVSKPVLEIMGAPKEVLDLAILYFRIYCFALPFIIIYNFGAAILRSIGDTKRPMYVLIASGIINTILNLILVIGFGRGVDGVAVATVIANMVSAAVIVYFLIHEESVVKLDIKKLYFNKNEFTAILKIGVPAGLQTTVFSISNVCIQTAINGIGADAMAGSTVALNFEYFTYYVITAFAQAATTFISQNYGAGKADRCKKAFRISLICGGVLCQLMSIMFIVRAEFFAGLYTQDPQAIKYALIRMNSVVILEGLTVTYEVGGAALRALGYSMTPAILTVIGTCLLRLVWLKTIFVLNPTFRALMLVYPTTWIITGAAVLIAYVILQKKAFANIKDVSKLEDVVLQEVEV